MSGTFTAEYLRSRLHYDPNTGIFTWIGKTRAGWEGKRAGCLDTHGHRQIGVDGSYHLAHRLAVLYVTGRWPDRDIDHRDGNRDNNRWLNLRSCNESENGQNQGKRTDNTSGYIGVSWNAGRGKWRADIALLGRRKFLGHCDTPEDAYALYLAAKAKLHAFQPAPRKSAA